MELLDLEKILPHKKPMILIDKVIDYSMEEHWLKSEVTIRENSLFYDKEIKGISSLVGIEYMAQTIGCYAYIRRNLEKPEIGFLLGTRLYNNLLDKFTLGEKYEILVKEIYGGNDIISFECFIFYKGEEVAGATINVYQSGSMEGLINV